MKIAEQAKKERLAQMQKDREALNTVFEQAQQDSDKAGKRIGADIAGIATANREAAAKRAADAKAAAAALAAEQKAANDAAIAAEKQTADEIFAIQHNAEETELRSVKEKFADRIKAYEKAKRDTAALIEAQGIEEQAIRDKYAKEREDADMKNRQKASDAEKGALSARLGDMHNLEGLDMEHLNARAKANKDFLAQVLSDTTLSEEARAGLQKDSLAFDAEITDAKIALAKKEAQQRVQAATTTANALNSFAALAGEQTAAGKVLAIASATINTYLSAQQAFTAMSGIPIVGPVLGTIAAAGAVAAGIVNVKKILSVQVPGKGGGGGSVPSMGAPISPSLNVQNTNTQLNQSSINAMQNATVKAVVVESDITNSQDRISRIHNAAKLE
jgi:hypothetical protein